MIQQWNHPYYIFLLVPLMVCAIVYLYHTTWKRLRAFVIEQSLSKNVPRISLWPFYKRAILSGLFSLVLSTAFLWILPKSLPLVSFCLVFALDVILILGMYLYFQSIVVSMGIVPQQILNNVNAFSHQTNMNPAVSRQFFLFISFALMILAVMGPEGSEKTTRLRRTPLVVTVVYDLSASMSATDVVPTRFEAAREELDMILSQCSGDEVGLVFFTSSAVVQAPQTFDYSAILGFLHMAGDIKMPVQGTDLNAALITALKTFNEEEDIYYQDTGYQTRRVVLITDGETHTGDIESTLKVYKDRMIHIDVIAVGTDVGSKLIDSNGEELQYHSEPVLSKANLSLLEHVSQVTDGIYTKYIVPELSAQTIIAGWDAIRIQTQPKGVTSSIYRVQLYLYFLIPAYILFLIFLLHPILCRVIMIFRKKKDSVDAQTPSRVSPYDRLRE